MLLFPWWPGWERYGNCGCGALANIWAIRSSCSLLFSVSSLWNERYPSSRFLSSSITILLFFWKVPASAFNPFAISLNACLLDLTYLAFLWGPTTTFLYRLKWRSQYLIRYLLLFYFPTLCFYPCCRHH